MARAKSRGRGVGGWEDDPLRGFERLAGILNGRAPHEKRRLPRSGQGNIFDAIEDILRPVANLPASKPIPADVVDRFNDLADQNRLTLLLFRGKGGRLIPAQADDGIWIETLRDILLAGRRRFKRCSMCEKWFVDRSPNHKKARCTEQCTWRWWSRSRRMKAGHKQPGKDIPSQR